MEVVEVLPFDYSYKYHDRRVFERLMKNSEADDVIIAVNDMVTDASYANLAFWDGSQWWTPETPLLNGVKRQHLLDQGLIQKRTISTNDVRSFKKVSLINAMLDLGDLEVDISSMLPQR